jgi:hypothetical protein
LRRFIDDVCVEIIETSLMSELGSIFNPLTVAVMAEDDIARIAGESDESREARRRLGNKIQTLRSGADICKELAGFRVRGKQHTRAYIA